MTNRDWAFSIERVRQQLGLATLLVVNNFTALAMALPGLQPASACRSAAARPRPTARSRCWARARAWACRA